MNQTLTFNTRACMFRPERAYLVVNIGDLDPHRIDTITADEHGYLTKNPLMWTHCPRNPGFLEVFLQHPEGGTRHPETTLRVHLRPTLMRRIGALLAR